ncbi:hypothetical protein AB1M95_15810 [Sulfitobacter sp. LCG007]
MFRTLLIALALSGVAACAPQVPDSSQGAGFENSADAQRQRDQALAGSGLAAEQPQTVLPPASSVASGPLDPTGIGSAPVDTMGVSGGDSAEATASETQRILIETRPALGSELPAGTPAPAPEVAAVQSPAPSAASGTPGTTITQNDYLELLQRDGEGGNWQPPTPAPSQVITPEALPERTGKEGPNIVAYAVQTTNPPGQSIYSRGGGSASRAARNCAQYDSPDQAQMDFLGRGGPERDSKGLDPDGDGFACTWDPTPFRKATGG